MDSIIVFFTVDTMLQNYYFTSIMLQLSCQKNLKQIFCQFHRFVNKKSRQIWYIVANLSTLQTYNRYSTLKRGGNHCFHDVSTRNKRVGFQESWQISISNQWQVKKTKVLKSRKTRFRKLSRFYLQRNVYQFLFTYFKNFLFSYQVTRIVRCLYRCCLDN